MREWAETRLWDEVRDDFVSWYESQPYFHALDIDPWTLFHIFCVWTKR